MFFFSLFLYMHNFSTTFDTDKISNLLQNLKKKKKKQDMTVPFARARAKLGGSIRYSDVTILKGLVVLQTKTCSRKTYFATFDLCELLTSVNI